MTGRARVEQFLQEHGVPYSSQHHPLAITGQDVAAVEHIPGRQMAKTVMVLADNRLVMLVIPATHEIDLDLVRTHVPAHDVRLAHETDFDDRFPDCEIGAMPPFGNLYGVPVYVDRALASAPVIVFRAGTHTETLACAYADFAELVRPAVSYLARKHHG